MEQLPDWTPEIKELEDFFNSKKIPEGTLQFSDCEKITDINEFISTGLSIAKQNNGKSHYYPYLGRLKRLKTLLEYAEPK